MSNNTNILEEEMRNRVQLAEKVQEIITLLDIAPADRAYFSKMSDSVQVAEHLLSELKKEVHSINTNVFPVNSNIS